MPTAPTMGVSDGLDGRSQAWSRSASALLLGALREAALPPDREQSVRQWLQSDASAAWHYMTGAAGEAARQAAAADGAWEWRRSAARSTNARSLHDLAEADES